MMTFTDQLWSEGCELSVERTDEGVTLTITDHTQEEDGRSKTISISLSDFDFELMKEA